MMIFYFEPANFFEMDFITIYPAANTENMGVQKNTFKLAKTFCETHRNLTDR